MNNHLQLDRSKFLGCAAVLLVLSVPAIFVAYMLHSWTSLVLIPAAIIALAMLAAWEQKKVAITTGQFADRLERHLLGTEGKWDWDEITSVQFEDERLETIRRDLPKFDSLKHEKDREEFRNLIAKLRSGDF